MVLDSIRNLIADKDPTPNKFTIAMGELIRKAREEAGMSQAELAQMIYRRQATLSDIENGKTEANTSTLILLAAALDKPPSYFYPPFVYREMKPDKLSPLEQDLLTAFQNIWSDHLKKVAIDQVRTLGKFDPMEMIEDKWIEINAILEHQDEIKSALENRHKKE